MSEETKALTVIEAQKKRTITQYTDAQREQIVEALFGHMADGHSLTSGCIDVGVHISTALNWIAGCAAWSSRYDELKILRSRALVEMALGEIEQNHDNFTVKVAESRSRTYLRVAALLNPKEFSDKMHTNAGKNGLGQQRVTFALNFGGAPSPDGSVTITYDPNEHEE